MRTSFHLFALGVGTWMTVGCVMPFGTAKLFAANAQPPTGQPQNDPEPPVFRSASNSTSQKPSTARKAPSSKRAVLSPLPRSTRVAQPDRTLPSVLAQRDADGDPLPPSAISQATPSGSTPLPPSSAPLPRSTGTPTPQPARPTTPAPSTPAPALTGTPTAKPVSVPNSLNPSPNPLQFPTRPSEVQIRQTQAITLQQALELAERNNRDLEVAQLQVERGRAALREARAGNFPTLAITADLNRSGSAFISREPSQLSQILGQGDSSATTTSFSTGAQLNYDLFTSGLRSANIRGAERQSRLTELQLEQTREDLRLQVTSDYYDLQDADSQVAINAAAVTNAEANLRDAVAQERAGLGTRFDVLRAEVNLANAQQQLRNAQATQEIRRRQLSQRLSIAESANLTAADPVVQAGTWTRTLEDSIVLAYRNRSELEQQLVQREISQEQIRAVRAANGPTLGFVASYQFQNSASSGSDSQSSDSYAFGLQARLNLFDGGATNARISQRQRDQEIAEARFAQNRNLVRFQVEQAYSNLQANLTNIATTARAVTQAEEALRLAILRFQAGVGTQTDRINAETELTRARGNQVSAIIGYNRALAQLQRAVSNVTR